MESIMNSVAGYFKSSESPQLCGRNTDTFCFRSIRDRHPVTITKIIDRTFKMGCSNPDLEKDTKSVAAKLSRLKNRLQTDKELELLEGEGADMEIWNHAIKQLKPNSNTWFSAPWLFIECYMYRAIHQAFQATASLTYPDYDTFRQEKCKGLEDSLNNMSKIAALLINQTSNKPPDKLLADFIKLSLWGNRADLSILKYFDLEISDVTDAAEKDGDEMILCNHLDKVVRYLLGLQGGQVGIILDNSGYELFGDMCLAEVVLRATKVSSVTLHMKSLPWFGSDVTDYDLNFLLDSLKGSQDAALADLGNMWESRFKNRQFIKTDHMYWTSPYGFCEMKSVSPDLYSELGNYEFLFFKGDLNYRKLVNDRSWPYDTRFGVALEGFNPTKLCALRTIKSDSIVECDATRIEKILEDENKDKPFCGAYALISSNIA